MELFCNVYNYSKYQIDEYGKVRNKSTKRLMKPQKCRAGYLSVWLINDKGIRKRELVHRLVAQNFKPNHNLEKTQVNHKDFNKENNHLSNLEWVTSKENMSHAKQGGRFRKPKKDKRNKAIKDLRDIGYTTDDLSLVFGVSQPRVVEILNRSQ